ncbi:MAG: thiamine diphosphokinase, partial [Kiritimatiellae bacterium]|nr:thiamine diphosphokinase [Kiritimatiellia bacterium]
LKALLQCDACICCDRLPPEHAPELLQIVGDMDSVCGSVSAHLVTDWHEDQETNDLSKALRWMTQHVPSATVDFFAVTGKREDHTLGNLALIAAFGKHTRVFTEAGYFELLEPGQSTLFVEIDVPISFLSFIPQRITARGVVWPVENLLLNNLWCATLNRTAGSTVCVSCEKPLFVYRPWSAS